MFEREISSKVRKVEKPFEEIYFEKKNETKLTLSRPGFFFDLLDRGERAPETPPSNSENIKVTAMKL